MKFNPFLTKGYVEPKYFCDRVAETKLLREAIENNRDVILYGRRKIGKSALMRHLFYTVKKKAMGVWVDLLPTTNFQDLTNELGTQLLISVEEESNIGNKLWKGVKSLRPSISYDQLSGQPSVSFVSQNEGQAKRNFSELIQLIASIKKKVVIAFDEFQQIMQYPESNVEAYLRTLMQSVPNLSLIYSGSDQSMIEHMFMNINRPFYQSGQLMHLGPIDEQEYVEFIQSHFQEAKVRIEENDIVDFIRWCNHRTINVQIIANRLYSKNTKKITASDIDQVKRQVLGELDDMYFTYRRIMTSVQWKVIIAFAKEGKVYEPYGKAFLQKYNFYNSSSVRRAVEKLNASGVLFHGTDKEGGFYEIDDIFFRQWIAS